MGCDWYLSCVALIRNDDQCPSSPRDRRRSRAARSAPRHVVGVRLRRRPGRQRRGRVACFKQKSYRAVITDLLMPGMDGFEVAGVLRTIDPAVKIIMLTGSAPHLTAGRAREAGPPLLHKPIALSDLKAAVDAAC